MKRLLSIRIALALLAAYSLVGFPQAASADLFLADTNNGDINTGTTWEGDTAPTSGDSNQWGSSTFTIRSTTQTWEGQEMLVQTGGRFASGSAGATVTFNGDLTLDGGTITTLNNNPFTIDLNGNAFNLNSGKLDSGNLNNGRDLIFQNAVLAGNGTVVIEGGEAAGANRSDVTFGTGVDTSGFTGMFDSSVRARFFLPEVTVANASFGINIRGSSGMGLTQNIAVTSALLGGIDIGPGTYTRDELLALGVNGNRVLSAGSDGFSLTVVSAVPEPTSLAILSMGSVALLMRRRRKS